MLFYLFCLCIVAILSQFLCPPTLMQRIKVLKTIWGTDELMIYMCYKKFMSCSVVIEVNLQMKDPARFTAFVGKKCHKLWLIMPSLAMINRRLLTPRIVTRNSGGLILPYTP